MTLPYALAQNLRDMGLTEPKPKSTPYPHERGWMPAFNGEDPPF